MRRTILFLSFVFLSFRIAYAETLYVPADYSTIQAAIDAASCGDTVKVGQGTYYENIAMKDGVNLEGGYDTGFMHRDPEIFPTTIDANQNGPAVNFTNVSSGKIEGFTITNSNMTGIYCLSSSPYIVNNIIQDNGFYGHGGGIANLYCYSVISGNTIANNHLPYWPSKGGGIYAGGYSSMIIRNNDISNNESSWGGGISIDSYSSGAIINNTIHNNKLKNDAAGAGGGIYVGYYNLGLTIANNSIFNNEAKGYLYGYGSGGGIFISETSKTEIVNNLIFRNFANVNGGVYASGQGGSFINNTIALNRALSGGVGGGLTFAGLTPKMINNIFWGNHSEKLGNDDLLFFSIDYTDNPRSISYSDIGAMRVTYEVTYSDFVGQYGNISADPLFLDPANDDYRLQPNSPAIDAGDPSIQDPDGTRSDMGAYPYPMPIDIDGDGVTDDSDNCPWKINPKQEDDDNDAIGNACETICSPCSLVKIIWSAGIANQGIVQSLLSKAENACMMWDKGNLAAAYRILDAVINEVLAQKGKNIKEGIADDLIRRAENFKK